MCDVHQLLNPGNYDRANNLLILMLPKLRDAGLRLQTVTLQIKYMWCLKQATVHKRHLLKKKKKNMTEKKNK